MKIVLCGGGSGGHITPIIAVAQSLKHQNPDAELVYVGHNKDKLADVASSNPVFSRAHYVYAGKFRRYHGQGIKQFFDIPTIIKNIRDLLYMIVGSVQSLFLLHKLKPDVIFIKGGFVGVPVGLAARALGIKYITHDSDSIPGLANRLIGKHATLHAVALSPELYSYPKNKTVQTGIPISQNFYEVNAADQNKYKAEIGISPDVKVILVTGGGLGAQRLNEMFLQIAKQLTEKFENLKVIHLTGRGKSEEILDAYSQLGIEKKASVVDFTTELFKLSGAADLIITRAGATTLAEFGAQKKPCIVVPNPMLTGGHQLKNAKILEESGAIVVVEEGQAELLLQTTVSLLNDDKQSDSLANKLYSQTKLNADEQIAKLILQTYLKEKKPTQPKD